MLSSYMNKLVKLLKEHNCDISGELAKLDEVKRSLIDKKRAIEPDKRFK